MHDFLFNSAGEGCIVNLTNLLESHNLQHVLHSKSCKSNEIKFPSFKRSLFYQEEIPECEKSNVAYLRVFKEPADDKDTIIRVLNFLYKVYEVDKKIKYLVVVGDGKTYEHFPKTEI